MDYPIPTNAEEMFALKNSSVNDEIIAVAIAGVVKIARQQGQSLAELTDSILHDDRVLDLERRKWLSQMITEAWSILPEQQDDVIS